jgi:hypothetical protein
MPSNATAGEFTFFRDLLFGEEICRFFAVVFRVFGGRAVSGHE